ncbi:MAG: DUF2892 domain-containing protein [Rhodospirillaceae bacterium]|nr:DUF2892 domain-containing protein [Rhodospirillaceae bacterium]
MNQNIGTADRIARVIAGIILLSGYFVLEGDAKWLALIGLVPLATAAMGYCPAYSLLGISTCSSDGAKHA